MIKGPRIAILADAVCTNCQRRIGWHDQYTGCVGFIYDPIELRKLVDKWFAENEPEIGFRSDKDVPYGVLIARAALARVEL